jgi:hypothetical protein
MKHFIGIIVITFSVLSIVSCKSELKKNAIVNIDQIIETNNNNREILNGSLLDSVKAYQDSASQLTSIFKSSRIDTLSNNDDLWLSYYYITSADKILKNYYTKHLIPLNENFDLSNTQLSDLMHDIKHSKMSDSLINIYIHQEDSTAQLLNTIATSRIEFARAHIVKYQDNNKNVKLLIQDLEKNN